MGSESARRRGRRTADHRAMSFPIVFAFSSVALSVALSGRLAFAAGEPQASQTPPPAQTTPPAQPPAPGSSTVQSVAPDAPTTTTPTAPGTRPLTLSEAINSALLLQPQITQATANQQATAERVTQAQSRYYPTVTPQYTYLSQFNYGPVSRFTTTTGGGGVVVTNQGTSNTTRNAELALGYRLYDSGVRDLDARQARQLLRGQEYATASTRQSVIGNVADAYFNALRTAALVRVAEAQVANTQTTLNVVQAQVQAGTAAQKEIFQAQADFANAQVSLLQARNNAAVAQAQLKNTIGVVGGAPLVLADVPAPTPDTPFTAILATTGPSKGLNPSPNNGANTGGAGETPATLSTTSDADTINRYSQVAYTARPDLAQAKQNVEVNQTNVSLARVNSRVLVTSDISASLQIDPVHFDKQRSNSRQINVLLSYPLFDAGFARSQVRSAQYTEQASEAQLQTLQQQVAVDVEQAYRNLAQARASLPAAQSALVAAQKNYEAASASRQEGVGSLVEVITAQTTLVQAQTNYVQAVYDFYAADARLATAVGQSDRIVARAAALPTTAPVAAPPPTVSGNPGSAAGGTTP